MTNWLDLKNETLNCQLNGSTGKKSDAIRKEEEKKGRRVSCHDTHVVFNNDH